jgi:hypothetical protein
VAASRAGIIVDEVVKGALKFEIRLHFKADGFRKNLSHPTSLEKHPDKTCIGVPQAAILGSDWSALWVLV